MSMFVVILCVFSRGAIDMLNISEVFHHFVDDRLVSKALRSSRAFESINTYGNIGNI